MAIADYMTSQNWGRLTRGIGAPWWFKSATIGSNPRDRLPDVAYDWFEGWSDFTMRIYGSWAAIDYAWYGGSDRYCFYPTARYFYVNSLFTGEVPTATDGYIRYRQDFHFSFLPYIGKTTTSSWGAGFMPSTSYQFFGAGTQRLFQKYTQSPGASSDLYDGIWSAGEDRNSNMNMAESLDFYKQGYASAPFVCYVNTIIMYAALTEEGDFEQVHYLDSIHPVHIHAGTEYYNFDDNFGALVFRKDDGSFPDDEDIESKKVPSFKSNQSHTSNEGVLPGTSGSPYVTDIVYNLDSYPQIRADLKKRYWSRSLCASARNTYLAERVDYFTNVLRETLLIPKEYRVRRQSAPEFVSEIFTAIIDTDTSSMIDTAVPVVMSDSAGAGGGYSGGGGGGY